MATKIGLMVGREWSFPPAFMEEVNRRGEDVTVEYVKLATPTLDDPIPYQVIVDRISHEVPFYRACLTHAALRGVVVVNEPFLSSFEDRFTAMTLAKDLGVRLPRTVVLPHREYAEGIVHEESLRNLDYPLDWNAVVNHVGLPCLLRDARGDGEPSYVCHSVEELLHHYNGSGQKLLVVQQVIEWEQFVRCFVIGQSEVLPLRYDPIERKYHVDHEHLSSDLGRRIVDDSIRLARAVGYDVNTVDWAIRDGTPWAVEFLNPVPEIDIYALTSGYFDWVVQRMADLVIRLATTPQPGMGRATKGALRGAAAARPGRKRVEGGSSGDGAGDLAEELPSLARDLPRTEL